MVQSGSNGEIEVRPFPSGRLGKDAEVIEQGRPGILDATISSPCGMARHCPPVGVIELPVAVPNIGAASKVIGANGAFGKKFVADLEGETERHLPDLLGTGGFFGLATSKNRSRRLRTRPTCESAP